MTQPALTVRSMTIGIALAAVALSTLFGIFGMFSYDHHMGFAAAYAEQADQCAARGEIEDSRKDLAISAAERRLAVRTLPHVIPLLTLGASCCAFGVILNVLTLIRQRRAPGSPPLAPRLDAFCAAAFNPLLFGLLAGMGLFCVVGVVGFLHFHTFGAGAPR